MKKKPTLLIFVALDAIDINNSLTNQTIDQKQLQIVFWEDFVVQPLTFNSVKGKEKIQSIMYHGAIQALLTKGINVITKIENYEIAELQSLIELFNSLASIQFKIISDTKANIIGHHSKSKVAKFQFLISNFDFSPRPLLVHKNIIRLQDQSLPKAIICDLDGTLALINDRNPFDASRCEHDLPNTPVVNMVKHYQQLQYKILLISGRTDTFKKQTQQWLVNQGIIYDALWMRKANDMRKDADIKKEIYEQKIEGQFYIEVVLDDRDQVVQLWRNELKLPCFQVYYGNF